MQVQAWTAQKRSRYISKYITKVFEAGLPLSSRYRYRASKITLEERRKLVFEAERGPNQALTILVDRLNPFRSDIKAWVSSD
jgi:hypothetical protein